MKRTRAKDQMKNNQSKQESFYSDSSFECETVRDYRKGVRYNITTDKQRSALISLVCEKHESIRHVPFYMEIKFRHVSLLESNIRLAKL